MYITIAPHAVGMWPQQSRKSAMIQKKKQQITETKNHALSKLLIKWLCPPYWNYCSRSFLFWFFLISNVYYKEHTFSPSFQCWAHPFQCIHSTQPTNNPWLRLTNDILYLRIVHASTAQIYPNINPNDICFLIFAHFENITRWFLFTRSDFDPSKNINFAYNQSIMVKYPKKKYKNHKHTNLSVF